MACKSCNLPLPEEGGEPKCTKCRHSFHLECANIKADLWKTMTKTKKKMTGYVTIVKSRNLDQPDQQLNHCRETRRVKKRQC